MCSSGLPSMNKDQQKRPAVLSWVAAPDICYYCAKEEDKEWKHTVNELQQLVLAYSSIAIVIIPAYVSPTWCCTHVYSIQGPISAPGNSGDYRKQVRTKQLKGMIRSKKSPAIRSCVWVCVTGGFGLSLIIKQEELTWAAVHVNV